MTDVLYCKGQTHAPRRASARNLANKASYCCYTGHRSVP